MQALRAADQLQEQYPDNTIVFEKAVKGGGDIDLAILNQDGTMFNAIQLKTNNLNQMHRRLTKGAKQLRNSPSRIKTIDMVIDDVSWNDFQKTAEYKELMDRAKLAESDPKGLRGVSINITFLDGITKKW